MEKHPENIIGQLARSVPIVIGLVLIWRGVWYLADGFDLMFLQGDHIFSAVFGILLGLLILYLPDKDLKEIEKL